jgi:hypothetical protein
MRVLKARRWYLVGVGVVVALIGAAFAYASQSSIPDASGEFHGCYLSGGNASGQLRVIDYPSAQCKNGETLIHWSATGPSGPPGPSGATNVVVRYGNFSTVSVASCATGERPTGGGYSSTDAFVVASMPGIGAGATPDGGTPTGWLVLAVTGPVQAYVVCASP